VGVVDKTDNPIVVESSGGHWCRKVSEGCLNCYAETMNNSPSFSFASGLRYRGEAPSLALKSDVLDSWRRAKKPAKRFVGSMTDIFGEWVPREWHVEILDAMMDAPSQTFLFITKRPLVMKKAIDEWCRLRGLSRLPDNIWCGVTMENQKRAEERIPILLEIPAKIRFITAEPLLSEIRIPLDGVDWVMVGGETGPRARPCDVNWIRTFVRLCKKYQVPIFVKQTGTNPTMNSKPAHRKLLHDLKNIRQLPDGF